MGVSGSYTHLLAHLPNELSISALQMPTNWQTDPPISLSEMASAYVQAIKTTQPEGPYHLCGWSFGGLLALEIATQLYTTGATIGSLIIIDTDLSRLPGYLRLLPVTDKPVFMLKKLAKLGHWVLSRIRKQAVSENMQYVYSILTRTYRRLLYKERIERKMYPSGIPEPVRMNMDTNFKIQDLYNIPKLPVKIHVLCASGRSGILEPNFLGWKLVSNEIVLRKIEGDHNTIMAEPNVSVLANELLKCLNGENNSSEE